MPFGISIWELLILLVVLLLVFGAKRLPEMGRSLGRGMREFKEAVTGVEDAARAATTPTSVTPPAELPTASLEHEAVSAEATESERETVS
ncbi:MAG: Sec-independent protein translocase protein TatA [Gaiellaceae bacterium]|jgi:sec-independent protein translocase protein TatA|nr:MAG: Sec-independent protein translocase protein TatA [Gaiellaceae bacterium]